MELQRRTQGAWTTGDTAGELFGFDYATSAPGSGQDRFTWGLTIPADGDYEVFARWPQVAGAASDAPYEITHDGGTATVRADQTQRPGEWVSLGRFPFVEGNQASITLSDDADGTVAADAVKLVRDNSGQTDTEAKDLTYGYDANGNLVEVSDNSSGATVDSYQVSYDGLNRVAQVRELAAGTVANTTSFTYNQVGAPLSRSHDDSHAAFAYNSRNLLTSVSNGDSASDPDPKVTSYTYTPRGQRATETKANGNTVSFDYWPDGALREQIETKPDTTVVASHVYEYDLNGNRAVDTSAQMNADDHGTYLERVATFEYDPRDRLAQVARTDPSTGQQVSSKTYVHDANNNVISQTIDGVTTTSSYDRNRLRSTTTAGVTSSYNYDPYGRLNTVTTAGQITERYRYDGFDRIIEKHTDGAVTRKTYDPLDRTATKTTNAGTADEETTEFVYLGLSEQVLAEIVDGQVTTTYQHGISGELLSQTKHATDGSGTEEDSFYGYSPHGDVAGITDESGDTRATYGYTAYGSDDESLFTGVDKPDPGNPEAQEPYNVYRYAGQRFDQASGTYDMGFRDYDPGLNRFLTRDSFNGALADMSLTTSPWTMSRYTFAGGNPTTLVEHDGHRPYCEPEVSCEVPWKMPVPQGEPPEPDPLDPAAGTPTYDKAQQDLETLSPEIAGYGIAYARFFGVSEELVIALLMQEQPFYAGSPGWLQDAMASLVRLVGEVYPGDPSVGAASMRATTSLRVLREAGYDVTCHGCSAEQRLRSHITYNDEFAVALAVLHLKLDLDAGMSEKQAYLSYSLDPDSAQRLMNGMVQRNSVLSARSDRYDANKAVVGIAGDLASYYGIEQLPVPGFGVEGGLCSRGTSCPFDRSVGSWLSSRVIQPQPVTGH